MIRTVESTVRGDIKNRNNEGNGGEKEESGN